MLKNALYANENSMIGSTSFRLIFTAVPAGRFSRVNKIFSS